MKPEEFVKAYKEHAKNTEVATGFPTIAILAQAALESGWGEHAPGNMFFGIKASMGYTGKKQLITTTEYCSTPTPDYPVVIRCVLQESGKYKCTVKDWFRAYDNPEESFTDHANFIINNKRYRFALLVKDDWRKFINAIAKAGYATAPNYANELIKVGNMIEKYL